MLPYVRQRAANRVIPVLREVQLHGPCSALFTVLLYMSWKVFGNWICVLQIENNMQICCKTPDEARPWPVCTSSAVLQAYACMSIRVYSFAL